MRRRPAPTRARAGAVTLAVAATLAAATLATLAATTTTARAGDAPCPAAARIAGERMLVAPIGRALRARGIATLPASSPGEALGPRSCAAISVAVRAAAPGFDLVINDSEGRTARRQLPSVESAALVIESWTRGDLAAPLPAPASAPTIPATRAPVASEANWLSTTSTFPPAAVPAPIDARPSSAVTFTPADPTPDQRADPGPPPRPLADADTTPNPQGDANATPNPQGDVDATLNARATAPTVAGANRLTVFAAGELGLARDGSALRGASGGLCVRFSRLCAGLGGRYAETALLPATSNATWRPLAQREVDLLAQLALPVRLGPVYVIPELGLGAGWASARGEELRETGQSASPLPGQRRDGHNEPSMRGRDGDRGREGHEPRSNPESSDPARTSTLANVSSAESASAERRLLGEARLTVALPLAAGFAVDLGISIASALPLSGATPLPRERLRGGLGLRYGGL